MERKKKEKSEEELRNENEFLKMRLMAEFGGDFVALGELAPDIENKFLKHISDFHKKQSKAEPRKIYDIIGQPDYDHTADLSDKEVAPALQKIQKKLRSKGIVVSSLLPVYDREMYRFITEDVFKIVVHFAQGRNMVLNILYEEYNPSNETEVKVIAQDLLNFMFDSSVVFIDHEILSEHVMNKYNIPVGQMEMVSKIELFKIQYKQMQIEFIEFVNFQVNTDDGKASLSANVGYKTRKSERGRLKDNESNVDFEFLFDEEKDMWVISKLECPQICDSIL